jgi:hypothetical protein
MKFNFQQERDFSEKINATFQFISENFKPLIRLLLLFVAPLSILAGIFQGLFQSGFGAKTQALATEAGRQMGAGGGADAVLRMYSAMGQGIFTDTYYLLALLFSFLSSTILVLIVNGYIIEYATYGTPVNQDKIFDYVKKYAFKILIFSILSTILSFIGLIFCLVPGIYLGVCLSLGFLITMKEDLSFGDAMNRCFYLIKDKWWSTFGLLAIMYIIFMFASMALALPTGILTATSMIGGGNESMLKTLTVILYALIHIMSVMFYTLFAVAIAFQYFNLVEKKEGTGLLNQIGSIGKKPIDTNLEGEY